MVSMRSRRLEGLLGGALDTLTSDNIRSLVDLRIAEAFDLDFKEQLYGHNDTGKRDLCGDVAAMANTAGGVIVIGISEDDSARAASAPGVAITEVEISRIRQIVAAGVSPMPAFDVLAVVDVVDGESGSVSPHGFVLIAVPRSPLAPHAVLINEGLRFPTRNGATTRYLSEPEVAIAYRERLLGAARQASRSEVIEADVLERIDRTRDAWLVVSLVPDLPGECLITDDSFAAFERWISTRRLTPFDNTRVFYNATVGQGRMVADDTNTATLTLARSAATELHTDGAGVLALRLWDISISGMNQEDDGNRIVSDEYLAATIIGALSLLAEHARDRAQTSGTAAVRAVIAPAPTASQTSLGQGRSRLAAVLGQPITTATEPVTTFATLDDLATPGRALVATAARLHKELGHAFGIPDLPQLTRDGKIVRRNWSRGQPDTVDAWAIESGVEFTE
ncbi:divergent AAA domain protein [mine drainage metagenome]|uniref:Divergent AAA domain protein n=1 Tax=mine drainage metagenome TaxID=410659 RepID=A0A1J5S2W2_9ZZZZ